MKVLDLGHLEAQFGLIIREKENHNNYVFVCLLFSKLSFTIYIYILPCFTCL